MVTGGKSQIREFASNLGGTGDFLGEYGKAKVDQKIKCSPETIYSLKKDASRQIDAKMVNSPSLK